MKKTVREWREEKQMTQEDVSHKSGIPYSTYRKKETGLRKWYFDELLRVCDAIGITITDVCNG